MNKDVIYIEPEDDITDIIDRIKNSAEKVVALVPPKKAGIMRSAVNMKLIAKTAKSKDKAVVIVTNDPSLAKLSAMSGLPVAKTLSSRPMLPSEFTKKKKAEVEELEENEIVSPEDKEEEIVDERPAKRSKKANEEIKLDEEEVEEDDKPKDKKKKQSKIGQKIPNFDKYRKFIIIGGVLGVFLIIALIWGLFIAPAAEILVNVKTTATNIAENVTLVTNQKDVDITGGKFLLEQIKYEEESSVEFEATGTANKGEKASGKVTVRTGFSLDKDSGSATLPAGSAVTIGDKKFTTASAATVNWDGKSASCDSRDSSTCYKNATVGVTASEAGTKYNIAAASSGGGSVGSGFSFVSSTAMTGGTDKNVKVVSESDVNDAKSQLSSNSEAKEKLYSQISDSVIKIDSSFKAEASDPVSSPKVNEEASDGKAKLTAKTTYTIYVVDKTAIEEYVKTYEKDKIADGDKLYSIGSPFFERFADSTNGTYTAKFKTTVKVGPEISEQKILETAMGGKVGAVKAKIKDVSSYINDVTINVSFPWVWSIPNDPNKVTVKLTVEE